MTKKKESVGVIKPKRVVKKSSEVDRLDAMQEQILNLNMAINHQGALATAVAELREFNAKMDSSFITRVKYLLIGRV